MAENKVVSEAGYGYEDDSVSLSSMKFGGNFNNTYLTKFEYNDHAGKEGAEGEALDVVFTIGGTEKNYRMFPVTKAFDENNVEITDPSHPKFVQAQKNFNAICVQILKCFRNEDDVKASLARRISSFKEFCGILMGMLPKNYDQIALDIFLQWQWQITGENNKTYLEIPKKISYGKFACAAVIPTSGSWTEVKNSDGMFYIDATLEQYKANPSLASTAPKHPSFIRNNWFVESKFFTQQKEGGEEALNSSAIPASGANGASPAQAAW